MFQDYLDFNNTEDVNDIMIKSIQLNKKPVVVFGCGERGANVTSLLQSKNVNVDSYCESSQYWSDGIVFLGKNVYDVNSLNNYYREANIIVAATGYKIVDYINDLLKHNTGYEIKSIVKRNQQYTMSANWVLEHENELNHTFNMFDDEFSRTTFLSFIGAKANCINHNNIIPLIKLWNSRQYFNELYPRDMFEEHILVDCGAWIGDSAEDFINFLKDSSKPVLVRAFEMEDNNYNELLSVAKKYNNNIICYRCGVGNKHQTLYYEKNSDASRVVDYKTEYSVDIVPVDEVLNGDSGKASFVKMDLEGYERYALEGMKNLIMNNIPMLAVCVYHKIDDLITIPNIIKEFEQESSLNSKFGYKYYLRHHSHNAAELVFYAVPYCR